MNEVPLGDFFRQVKEEVTLEDDVTYQTVGVLSYGKGLFERPPVTGAQTSYKSYFRIHANQFVYSKLFAWEGAVAVVPHALDGRFVSQEFPTFDIDTQCALPQYVALLCRWAPVWARLRHGETGMGGRRKRVHPSFLTSVLVPLPSIRDQRRIVDLVAATDHALGDAQATARAAGVLAQALREGFFADGARSSERSRPLSEAVEVTMGRQRAPRYATGEHLVPYLRAANVKDGHLDLSDVLSMNFDPKDQKTFHLVPGDVLVTEGCGSLRQLGAAARWQGEIPGVVCFQNTLLRLRAIEGRTTPGFVEMWARFAFQSGMFAAVASGTNIFHLGSTRAKSLPITVPPLDVQEQVVGDVAAADECARRARQLADDLEEVRSGLMADVLSGTHEIPDTYDALLQAL